MTAPLVRAAGAGDWDSLWPMLQAMGSLDDEVTTRARLTALLDDPSWCVLLAESDGVGVGYAAAQDHGPHLRSGDHHRTVRLHDMFTFPDRRRHGVGRALLDGVLAWASDVARYVEWQASADGAALFYEHLGHRGDPCPQPEFPTFEVDLGDPTNR